MNPLSIHIRCISCKSNIKKWPLFQYLFLRKHLQLDERKYTRFRHSGQKWTWRLSNFLESRPCIANAINTGLVMGIGDTIAQTILESRRISSLDFERLSRFLGLGFCLAGPGMHYWYSALDKYVTRGTRTATTVRKILLDQVLFLPLYLLIYLTILAALRGDRLQEINSRIKRDMYPALMDSYKVWPLAQTINFYLLPLKFRIIFINAIALFWNMYIGWKAEKKLESPVWIHSNSSCTVHKGMLH